MSAAALLSRRNNPGLNPIDPAQADGLDGQHLRARQINRILDSEHGRWLSASFDRLRQFGYRFDTF